jgi:three-Cys-motif partner protein
MTKHKFGGDWTTEKLERIRKYLAAYTVIFDRNPKARKLTTIYVDAFAGTGYRSYAQQAAQPLLEFDDEAEALLKGSARIALEIEPAFKHYLFIEQNEERARELEQLKAEFPAKADQIEIVPSDANRYLQNWCAHSNWQMTRAVVFLDPYGMQVEWPLIQAIAATQAIDLWILFPLGIAVNRLLTKAEPPPPEWADRLSRLFGTDTWQTAFYPSQKVLTLFGEQDIQCKQANFAMIGSFFVDRLRTVFTAVADNPLPLCNSRNVPLYLLCFAAGNPRGAPTAIRIAQNILQR